MLINANLVGLEVAGNESMSTSHVDEYLRQVDENRNTLDDHMQRSRGIITTLKCKYEEFAKRAEEIKNESAFYPSLIVQGEVDLARSYDPSANTIAELAQDYYDVWQQQESLIQLFQDLKPQLTLRFVQAKQIRRRLIAQIGANYVPWSPNVDVIPPKNLVLANVWTSKEDPEMMRLAAEVEKRIAGQNVNATPDDAT